MDDFQSNGKCGAHIVRNGVLATLPEEEFDLLRPYLKPVPLKRNTILHDANKIPDAVYFIETGMISRVIRTRTDGPVEVAMVGNFGFVGVSVVLGTMSLQRTIVQIAGSALRINADDLQRLMSERPGIKSHLLKYIQMLLSIEAQFALCNAKHEIDERVARWMLLVRDIIADDNLPVTHSTIASSLGVRRPGVSKALAVFESQQIIERARGLLRIVDFDKLNQNACECRKIISDKFNLVLAKPRNEYRLDAVPISSLDRPCEYSHHVK